VWPCRALRRPFRPAKSRSSLFISRYSTTLVRSDSSARARSLASWRIRRSQRLIDAGLTASGEPYLALEYVEGQSIDSLLRRAHRLTVEARIRLFLDVLSAVRNGAASTLIVRIAISSQLNVFTARMASRAVGTFGIAKVLSGEEDVTSATLGHAGRESALTPMFSAPRATHPGQITNGHRHLQPGRPAVASLDRDSTLREKGLTHRHS